ncbi:hypothetical protein HRI_003248900 [Hibiscus trionum]|uniref:Uncharacterized protein n=1 Tax=Hibiscus trionum TaxID=183268 RepID=A0A9W7MCP2_HIBTR|nr:hypothetical protein HRI_003248900 [Hibiscus trionum]
MSTPPPREWVGLQQFPAATQTKLFELLGKLKQENVNTLTILVMGKGASCSSNCFLVGGAETGNGVTHLGRVYIECYRYTGTCRGWLCQSPSSLVDQRDSTIPVVLVENSGRCNKNDNDEKILPNGDAWIPNLVKAITTVATNKSQAIVISKKLVDGSDANDKGKLWIPVILGLQWFVIKWIQGAIKRDIATGNGPI